jgi:hypothetical protein
MPYWNEIPGAGEPSPLNRSRRRGLKHGLFAGIAIMLISEINKAISHKNDDPVMAVLNLVAAVFVVGPLFGLMVLGPFLGFFYQWLLIRNRERNCISRPSSHSYGGDKWLELDDDDSLRADVEARLRARSESSQCHDATNDR